MQWKPNVTVAAIIERDGHFLLVEEDTRDGRRINQPAGHLEAGESIIEAVIRETWEETACQFRPSALVGIYQWRHPVRDLTYLRFAFCGEAGDPHPGQPLDHGIVGAVWMDRTALSLNTERHRSPLVQRCIDDYLAGKRYPLEILTHYD